MNAKLQIKEMAIQLFNEHGFGKITIRNIADALQVDRRNVSYHYKTTDDILEVVAEEMWAKIQSERQKKRDFPSFENLNNEALMNYHLQNDYAFIYNDVNVIKHPCLQQKFQNLCESMIKDNEESIAFAIKQGNMKQEPFPGAYYNLSITLWLIAIYGRQQQEIRKVKRSSTNQIKMIWSLILPHFTEKGVQSFITFFGQEFYDSLGEPFNVHVNMQIF